MTKAAAFTAKEFIRAFRPDGKGHITIEDGAGSEVSDVSFDEIVCDLCNAELIQPKDEPNKKIVFVLDGYALCHECRESVAREGESPLHAHPNTELVIEALEDYRRWFDGADDADTEKRGAIELTIQRLKGGGETMAEENQSAETATMCATKAGNGYKVVVNGVWFYASKRQVLEMIDGRQKACTFHTIKDEEIVAG